MYLSFDWDLLGWHHPSMGFGQSLVPLVLGILGLTAFLFFEGLFEGKRFCREPAMPLHLFKNRTSTVAFILTFLHGIMTVWVLYFLPVYFQGVRLSSPIRSGVELPPTALFMTPFAAVGGGLAEKLGKYKPIHVIGFVLMTVGLGIFSLLHQHSSTAEWVIFQAIEAAGLGLIISTVLPAVQAKLCDADTAKATATWQLVRSFGLVFGSTIPASVFNTHSGQLSSIIREPAIRNQISGGHAYEHAMRAFALSVPTTDGLRQQVIAVFTCVETDMAGWYCLWDWCPPCLSR